MIDLNKRSALRLAALSAAALTLVACGKKEEAAPAAAPAPTAAPAPAAAEPLKAAWIYVGPVGDGGWSFAHDNARKAVQKELVPSPAIFRPCLFKRHLVSQAAVVGVLCALTGFACEWLAFSKPFWPLALA